MYIQNRPVLHCVDRATHYQAAEQLANESGISCRPISSESANAMNVGGSYHKSLRDTFLKRQEKCGMQPTSENAEPKSISKKGKKAREVSVDDKYLLKIAVMTNNSTIGSEGLCPTLLLFGSMPKLPIPGSQPAATPTRQGMMMIEDAREKYIKIVVKMRLKRLKKH